MAKLEIGTLVQFSQEIDAGMQGVADLGLAACQVVSWEPDTWTAQMGRKLIAAGDRHGVRIVTLWAGYSGPCVWNFIEGPLTIGLVPPQSRRRRTAELLKAAEFAAEFGLPSITTHVGFLPEDPNDRNYLATVKALQTIAGRCAKLGVEFWFETGQETPVNLLRTIERVGTGNLGINLDPANLILYGKANPVDALDVFGKYVRGAHAKDGLYPTDGEHLGKETPLGAGKADFPVLVSRLKKLGFKGVLAIEREISGPQQIKDIKKAIKFLQPLC